MRVRPSLCRALASLTLVIAGCSTSAPQEGPPPRASTRTSSPEPGPARQPAGATQAGRMVRLKALSVADEAIIGGEAFRILIPVGWQAEGGVVWRAHPAVPATVAMTVRDPAAPSALQILPNLAFTWVEGGIPFFPVGSTYIGNEVRPPIADPAEYISRIVVPRLRPQLAEATVAGHEELTELAQAVASTQRQQQPGVPIEARAGKTRFEYQEGGRAIQEDVYCALMFASTPVGVFWGTDRLFAFKAEQGMLDERARLFHTMLASMRLNLVWFNKYQQLVQMLVQNQLQATRNAGELSRYIARTNDQITDMIRQSYAQRQASEDRISANFSQYIRGVEEYQNPFEGRPVELPSGYGEVWANSQGEYVLADRPNFDPNVGSNVEWRRLDKKP